MSTVIGNISCPVCRPPLGAETRFGMSSEEKMKGDKMKEKEKSRQLKKQA